ncbi:preprotein translocase subunit SecG [Maricaulis sp.]|uniref:preprotein translocase subunit SecG n=1 Tax=Maricaulis sp. TaxID=1486257 RepID=UPI0025C3E88B|nr:preprotein translocase subunit SecG [Maricaulis sp.]
MTTVLLIIQLLVALGLIGVILLQRSEGGALGIGGGGGGGMMSGRGAANILTRTTMILAAVFIGNSILLAIVTGVTADGDRVFDTQIENLATGTVEDDESGTPVPTDG